MKQYCRYCNNLVTGNGIYCGAKNKTIKESTAKRTTNNCKEFEFNPIDAFGEIERGYRPKGRKAHECEGQVRIRLEEEDEESKNER